MAEKEYHKSHPGEHYEWPLRKVAKVIRKGREHTDVLVCGHTYVWRGSSSWAQGENEMTKAPKKRRCQQCFAEDLQKVEGAFNNEEE